MCVCVVCILYCHTISWNIPMVFAYSLTQLAPFSLGLHSSSKLSSPEQHPWSVILQGMQRTLSRKVVSFSSVWLCAANSHLWLDIASCWLFTLGELLSNLKTQTKLWKFPSSESNKNHRETYGCLGRSGGEKTLRFRHSTAPLVAIHSLHLSPPWDVQSLHGYHQMLAWQSGSPTLKNLGMPGCLQRCQVESWNLSGLRVGCCSKLEWSVLVIVGGWGGGIELSNSPILRVH